MLPTSDHPKRDLFIQMGIGVLIVFLFVVGVFLKAWLFDK
jgi:hypothetical protein